MNPPPAATSTGRCVNCSQWGDTTDTSLIPMWYLGLGCQDWISDKVDYEGSPTDLFIVVQWFRWSCPCKPLEVILFGSRFFDGDETPMRSSGLTVVDFGLCSFLTSHTCLTNTSGCKVCVCVRERGCYCCFSTIDFFKYKLWSSYLHSHSLSLSQTQTHTVQATVVSNSRLCVSLLTVLVNNNPCCWRHWTVKNPMWFETPPVTLGAPLHTSHSLWRGGGDSSRRTVLFKENYFIFETCLQNWPFFQRILRK